MLIKSLRSVTGRRGPALAVAALLLLAAGCTVLAQTGGLDTGPGRQPGSVGMPLAESSAFQGSILSGAQMSLLALENCFTVGGALASGAE